MKTIKELSISIDKKVNSFSLRKKIIIAFIIVVAIPIIVIPFIFFNYIEKGMTEDALKKHKYELEAEYVKVESNINTMENIAQSVSSNKDVIKYISKDYSPNVIELQEFNRNTYKDLSNLQNNNENIKEVNVFTNNIYINEFWPFIYMEERVDNNDWYNETISRSGQVYWNINHYNNDIYFSNNSNNNFNNYSKELMVSLSRELKNEKGEHIGIVRVSMKSDKFSSMMVPKNEDSYNQMFIYNKKTREIHDKDNKSYLNIGEIDKRELFSNIEGKFIEESGTFDYTKDNQKLKILYKKIPLRDSYIIDVINLRGLTADIYIVRIITIVSAIVLLLILVLAINKFTSIILKRLYVIIDRLKKIKRGNFDVDIPIYGEDEIGLLAHNFRSMLRTIDGLIKDGVNKEMATKEAELKALKAQIDSHFLYNTLENIRMLAEIDGNYRVSDSLVCLGNLMRYNTKWNNEYVLLKEEISHINNYVSLMSLRYDNDIKVVVNIGNEFLNTYILKLMIQPLVENAVKHGISKKLRDEECIIYINVENEDQFIIINVIDYGIGMDEKKVKSLQNHIDDKVNDSYGLGLRNVCQRLKLFYGNSYGIFVESRIGEYTKLILKIPKS